MSKYDGRPCARCGGNNWLPIGRCGDCPCKKCDGQDFDKKGRCLQCAEIEEKRNLAHEEALRKEKGDELERIETMRQKRQNEQDEWETKLNDFYFIKTSHICAIWKSTGEPAKIMLANGKTFDISIGAAGELSEKLKNKNPDYFEYINQDINCIRPLVKADRKTGRNFEGMTL